MTLGGKRNFSLPGRPQPAPTGRQRKPDVKSLESQSVPSHSLHLEYGALESDVMSKVLLESRWIFPQNELMPDVKREQDIHILERTRKVTGRNKLKSSR